MLISGFIIKLIFLNNFLNQVIFLRNGRQYPFKFYVVSVVQASHLHGFVFYYHIGIGDGAGVCGFIDKVVCQIYLFDPNASS